MSQTVTVSLERQGRIFDLDTECMALGTRHIDLDELPENERSGTAKRLLGSSVLYCYIGSFADALQARGASFRKIAGTATVEAGDDGTGRRRILRIALDIDIHMDASFNKIYEHVAGIMKKGCLVSASLEQAFPITYNVNLIN